MAKRLLSQLGLNGNRPPLTWARIGTVAGVASDTQYIDSAGITWRCVQWNASSVSGLVLATPGLLDCLIVGGGAGAPGSGFPGNGGGIKGGLFTLESGMHAVTVGLGGVVGSGTDGFGKPSSLGSLQTSVALLGATPTHCQGAGGTLASPNAGLQSSISGSAVTYAAGNAAQSANSGNGGVINEPGSSGTVVVRVPV